MWRLCRYRFRASGNGRLTQSPFHCGYCTRQALINDLVWNSCPSGDGDFRVDQDYSVATPIDFRSLGEDSPALT